MSKQKYEKKADKVLAKLVKASEHIRLDDEIRILTKAIQVLNHDYASVK